MDNRELKRLSLKLIEQRLSYVEAQDHSLWTNDQATFVKETLKTLGQAVLFDDGTEAELGDQRTRAVRKQAQRMALAHLEFLDELGVENWSGAHATWVKEIQKLTIEEDIQESLYDYSDLTDDDINNQLEAISASRTDATTNLLGGRGMEAGQSHLLAAPRSTTH